MRLRPTAVRPTTSQESDGREAAIRHDAASIRAECQQAAGGDWDEWQRRTEPARQALQARVAAMPTRLIYNVDAPSTAADYISLEPRDDFPLQEVKARERLVYLLDAAALKEAAHDGEVVAADRWLQQRGIDLVFVPIPRMVEVYAEHFVDPCPADGIVAPHVRRVLLDMLEADVEAFDAFPRFRAGRNPDPDYLYLAADTHWAPAGMRLMAKELAARLSRYDFVAQARSASPVVKVSPLPEIAGTEQAVEGWRALTPRQRQRVSTVRIKTGERMTMPDGSDPPDDPRSPLLVVGHSFVPGFREQLIRELNMLFRTRWSRGHSTQCFGDFLRQPEMLDGVRVVVWLSDMQQFMSGEPMPAPVMVALREEP
jgi:hypothetical protein